MVKRIAFLSALISFALPLHAANPLGRRGIFRSFSSRTSSPPTNVAQPPASPYRHLMDSPEKLTELFGPSILVRRSAHRPDQVTGQVQVSGQTPSSKPTPSPKPTRDSKQARVSRFVTQPTD